MTADAMSDLLVFLARARRLDPHALARLQPVEGGGRAWAVLPFGVLATRVVPVAVSEDVTVRVSDLFDRARGAGGLASVEGLSRHDGQWRGGTLPDPAAPVIERMAAHECRRIGDEAGTALRAAQEQARVDQRAVGERKLRDTLLDHVALTVTAEATRYEIPVRLVVGLLRMAFAGDGPVLVRRSGRRLGLEGVHGGVWLIGGGLPLLT